MACTLVQAVPHLLLDLLPVQYLQVGATADGVQPGTAQHSTAHGTNTMSASGRGGGEKLTSALPTCVTEGDSGTPPLFDSTHDPLPAPSTHTNAAELAVHVGAAPLGHQPIGCKQHKHMRPDVVYYACCITVTVLPPHLYSFLSDTGFPMRQSVSKRGSVDSGSRSCRPHRWQQKHPTPQMATEAPNHTEVAGTIEEAHG
jgi:hypothetical protein